MNIIPTTSAMEKHMTSIELYGLSSPHQSSSDSAMEYTSTRGSYMESDDAEVYKEIRENEEDYDYGDVGVPTKDDLKVITHICEVVVKKTRRKKDEIFEF